MVLIITGTISPMVQDSEVVVRDCKERLKQYKDCIYFFLESGAFRKIIIGENSNYPQDELEEVFHKAKERNVELEYLTFQGDSDATRKHGKGYGEGEIMKYIFQNSKLLAGETSFMKITGRLKLDQACKLVKKCKEGRTYFNIPKPDLRDWYDTRLYVMPVKIFQAYFIDAYKRVEDSEKRYLEVVYTDVLEEHKIKVNNFPRFPRVVGVSGSTGAAYVYSEWKCKIKDVLSIVQYYKIRQ